MWYIQLWKSQVWYLIILILDRNFWIYGEYYGVFWPILMLLCKQKWPENFQIFGFGAFKSAYDYTREIYCYKALVISNP